MNEEQTKQAERKYVWGFIALWLIVMCVACAPPEQSTFSVLWDLFFGGLVLFNVVAVFVWVINKIG